MGCDCNVYMHGECGHFQLGHSLGLSMSAIDQQEPPGVVSASFQEAPVASTVECPPPTPGAWVQSPLPAAGVIRLFGIYIYSDILLKCLSSAESTCVILN